MRRYRQRRKDGLQRLRIDLREREIDELVRRGFLCLQERGDRDAIRKAFYACLDRTLGASAQRVTPKT
jgi:hypothetical protein